MTLRKMKMIAALVTVLILLTAAVTAYGVDDTRKREIYYGFAIEYSKSGDYAKAMEYLDSALELCDEEADKELCADIHLKKASVYYLGDQDIEKALAEVEETLRVYPEYALAYTVKAEILESTGNYAGAAESGEKYIEYSGDIDYYNTVSRQYLLAGDNDKATEAYQKYLDATHVEGAESIFNMASFKVASGLYEEAIADFETILEDADYGKTARYSIGVCYLQMGKYEEALAVFDACAEFASEVDGITYNTGVCKMKTNNLEEAIELFTKSIETESYKADALFNRAICHVSLQQFQEAVDDFTASLAEETASLKAAAAEGEEVPDAVGESNFYRAACYLSLQEYDKAIADYTACIENNILADQSLINRGLVYLQSNRLEEAKADLTEATGIESVAGQAYYYRAVLLDAEGNPQGAIDDLTAAIELEYNLGDTYYLRGTIYQEMGETEKWESDWQKALEY